MKAIGSHLASVVKHLADIVVEGLELKPVSGPVKNATAWIVITFAILLIGAKLAMSVGAVVVVFLLFVAVLLLQWNRSLLWHRALLTGRRGTPSPTGSQHPE